MSRLFGLMVSDPRRMRAFLAQHAALLTPPTELNCDGYGVGYYQADRALLVTRPRVPGARQTYADVVGNIESDTLIVHGRQPTVGNQFAARNTHPFRYKNWMLAHVGTLSKIAGDYAAAEETLPTFLSNNLKGDTDTELLLSLFLARLGEAARIDDPDLTPDEVARCLRETVNAWSSPGESPGVVIASNGRMLVGLCMGWPLYLLVQNRSPEPLPEVEAKPPINESTPGRDSFKGVLLVSTMAKAPAPYERLPDRSVVVVTRALDVMVVE